MEHVFHALDRLGAGWFNVKTAIEHSIAFHDDALHVIVGVLLQFAVAAVLRRPISGPLPWLAVLVLELINEASDLRWELWPKAERSMQIGEGVKDVLLTMLIPSLLLLIARKFPRLLGKLR